VETRLASLKSIATDKNKKNYFVIVKELSSLWIKDGEFPKQYFLRLAYKKGAPNYKNFTPESVLKKLWLSKELHSEATTETLRNKIKFEEFCRSKNIPTPKILGHNDEENFFFNGVRIRLEDSDLFLGLLKEVLQMTESNSVFLKPLAGIQGRGCFKINFEQLEDIQLVEEIFKTIVNSKYIIQETIKQHPQVSKIYAHSVNTVRLDTYIKEDGQVEILSGLMRFGVKEGIVDNPRAGGFFMPLDLQKGVLKDYGMQPLTVGNKIFYQHPDTLVSLVGYRIPYVDEAKALVKRAAKELGDRLVGWDVAISEDGPILIEGNSNYAIGMAETAYGGYMQHELFREIVKKYA